MVNVNRTKNTEHGFTLIELMIVVAIIGILAAVAIPAFMKNAKKAKTTEAVLMIKKISDGAVSYYHEESNRAGSAVPIDKQFPSTPAVALEPALGVCCAAPGQKCAPDSTLWRDPSWQALHFSMDDPHYYSYEYVSTLKGAGTAPSSGSTPQPLADGTTPATFFFAGARGDLNCDTVYSTFEMFGAIAEDGSVTTGAGVFKSNELE